MKRDATKAAALLHLKKECSQPKTRLLDILRMLRSIDPAQADKLGRIIGRLEDWQNK